jgi:quinol monooxygenase YgiN
MIVLVVKFELQEGKKGEFLKIAKPMIEGSKKEAGNIEYDLYEELDEANTVAFIEKWKDQEAIEEHRKMEHFTNNFDKLKALCIKPLSRNRFDVAKY